MEPGEKTPHWAKNIRLVRKPTAESQGTQRSAGKEKTKIRKAGFCACCVTSILSLIFLRFSAAFCDSAVGFRTSLRATFVQPYNRFHEALNLIPPGACPRDGSRRSQKP